MMVVMIMDKLSIPVRQRSIFLIFLSWALVAGFPVLAIGDRDHYSCRYSRELHKSHLVNMGRRQLQADNHHRSNTSYKEQDRLRRNFKEWKSLSPENRNVLRHRMDQWKELSPEERTLYQKRYHQFQQLPPDERGRVREKLDQWDKLSPQEKDEIRRCFPRH